MVYSHRTLDAGLHLYSCTEQSMPATKPYCSSSTRMCFFSLSSLLCISLNPLCLLYSPPRPFLRLVDKKLLCASYSLVSVKANRAKKRIALYIDRSLRSDKGDWMGLEVALRSRARESKRKLYIFLVLLGIYRRIKFFTSS